MHLPFEESKTSHKSTCPIVGTGALFHFTGKLLIDLSVLNEQEEAY